VESLAAAIADDTAPTTLATEAFARPVPPLPEPPPTATEELPPFTVELPPGMDQGTLAGAAATAVTRARRLLEGGGLSP
jgi:hypothetical protein